MLAEGHAAAERVERAIRDAAPLVETVQSDLEPIDPEIHARPVDLATQTRLPMHSSRLSHIS